MALRQAREARDMRSKKKIVHFNCIVAKSKTEKIFLPAREARFFGPFDGVSSAGFGMIAKKNRSAREDASFGGFFLDVYVYCIFT